jgi:ribonuclease-3
MSEVSDTMASARDSLVELETLLRYQFQDQTLLLRALTHRSFVNEHEDQGLRHNESMEFLGDAVLGFLISARIFGRFPDCSEGELSKIKAYLVSAVNLFHLAERIHLGDFLLISRGEEKTGGRKKRAILVDTYEAILGAMFLDGGVDVTLGFLDRQLGDLLKSLDLHQLTYGDFKSALQEQLHNMGRPEPVYRVVDEIGPDHRKVFVVEVVIGDSIIARSSGRTKKEAQQEAARIALEGLKESAAPINNSSEY